MEASVTHYIVVVLSSSNWKPVKIPNNMDPKQSCFEVLEEKGESTEILSCLKGQRHRCPFHTAIPQKGQWPHQTFWFLHQAETGPRLLFPRRTLQDPTQIEEGKITSDSTEEMIRFNPHSLRIPQWLKLYVKPKIHKPSSSSVLPSPSMTNHRRRH